MRIQDVIDAYHDLLTDEEMVAVADAHMRTRLKERGLYFGDRPLCVVLRPHFYLEDDWKYLKRAMDTLLMAFSRAHTAAMTSGKMRAQLHLDPWEEFLFRFDIGSVVPWTSSRIDTFFQSETKNLRIVEYNAETPAGIGYGDVLKEVFMELRPMTLFREKFNVESMKGMPRLGTAILDAYGKWGGGEKPQIAILDWQDVPTITEHEITRQYFEREMGLRSILADPRDLEYRKNVLYHKDFRIDIIYKRVLWSELVQRMGVDNPVVHAMKDKTVFITNSPSAKLMAKKASLAMLSDEQNHHIFSGEQLAAIAAHIPWTRIVKDRKTRYQGEWVDLLDLVSSKRENFVLKPNDEYGGKGVYLGWHTSQQEWDEIIKQALYSPYVVQERVHIVQRDFPMLYQGKLDISSRFVDADPYIYSGRAAYGVLTRLSGAALLNVTAGGGSVVPTFIVSEKS